MLSLEDIENVINEVDGKPKLSLQEEIIQSIIDICHKHLEDGDILNFKMGIDTTSDKTSDVIYLKIYPTSKLKSFIINLSRRSYKALLMKGN